MFSLALQHTKNDVESIKILSKKVRANKVDFSNIKIASKLFWNFLETPWMFLREKLHRKKYVEARWIFRPSKSHRKKCVETTETFRPSKLHRESMWKQCGFFGHWDYVEKSAWKQRGFSTIEITSKKVRGNNVDILTSEIRAKKYVETTSIFGPS